MMRPGVVIGWLGGQVALAGWITQKRMSLQYVHPRKFVLGLQTGMKQPYSRTKFIRQFIAGATAFDVK